LVFTASLLDALKRVSV